MSGMLEGLFGGKKVIKPDYTGLQIQTAVNTLPIPIVWGMSKLAPNLIWYGDFETNSGGGKGGKGGLFGGGGTTSYSASIIMALCEGLIGGINLIWRDQAAYTLSSLGLTLFDGAQPQAPWSYMTTYHSSQALGYEGTCYVAAANYNLGDAAIISNHNFEVQGLRYGTGYGQLQFELAIEA
ncbi:MAG: hypothetical protein ACREH9_04515, partial [Pseudomonadota bacterium]